MSDIGRVTLFGKQNPFLYAAIAARQSDFERLDVRWQAERDAFDAIAGSRAALIDERCRTIESGGRMVDAILTHTVLPRISQAIMRATVEGRALSAIEVGTADSQCVYRFDEEVTT